MGYNKDYLNLKCYKLHVIALIAILMSCNGNHLEEKKQNDQKLPSYKKTNIAADLQLKKLDSSIMTSKSIFDNIVNHKNTVYVKSLKYTHDGDFNKIANITIENTTKHLIIGVLFHLDGYVDKGCSKSYKIKRKTKLKPNQSINFSQLIAEGDCEAHVIEYVNYVLSDGTVKIGGGI